MDTRPFVLKVLVLPIFFSKKPPAVILHLSFFLSLRSSVAMIPEKNPGFSSPLFFSFSFFGCSSAFFPFSTCFFSAASALSPVCALDSMEFKRKIIESGV